MNIVNGQVDLALNNNSSIHLEDASIIIQTQRLLTAKKASGLEHAVEYLDFKTGTIKTNNLNIQLHDVRYAGDKNRYLLAKKVQLNDKLSRTVIIAENAAVDEILIDEEAGDLTANGIRWDRADAKVFLPEKGQLENTGKAAIEESKQNIKKWSKQDEENFKKEGEEICKELTTLLKQNFKAHEKEVQSIIRKHYLWINKCWTPTKESYADHGDLIKDSDLRKAFEAYHPKLPDFIAEAIQIFANKELD